MSNTNNQEKWKEGPFVAVSTWTRINIHGTTYMDKTDTYVKYKPRTINKQPLLMLVKQIFHSSNINTIRQSSLASAILEYREFMRIPNRCKHWLDRIDNVILPLNYAFIDTRDLSIWTNADGTKNTINTHHANSAPIVNIHGHTFPLIRVYANAFIPRPVIPPDRALVASPINGDPLDVRISNIEWTTRKPYPHIYDYRSPVQTDLRKEGPYRAMTDIVDINIHGTTRYGSRYTVLKSLRTTRRYNGLPIVKHVQRLFHMEDIETIKQSQLSEHILRYKRFMDINTNNKMYITDINFGPHNSVKIFVNSLDNTIWDELSGRQYPIKKLKNRPELFVSIRSEIWKYSRLLAEAYLPKPHGIPKYRLTVAFKDGDTTNLDISNMKWVDKKNNR